MTWCVNTSWCPCPRKFFFCRKSDQHNLWFFWMNLWNPSKRQVENYKSYLSLLLCNNNENWLREVRQLVLNASSHGRTRLQEKSSIICILTWKRERKRAKIMLYTTRSWRIQENRAVKSDTLVIKLRNHLRRIDGRLNQARRLCCQQKKIFVLIKPTADPPLVTFHLSSTRHWCGQCGQICAPLPFNSALFRSLPSPQRPYILYRTLFPFTSYGLVSFIQKILLPVHWILLYDSLSLFICATAATEFHHFYESVGSRCIFPFYYLSFFFLSFFFSILLITYRKMLQLR